MKKVICIICMISLLICSIGSFLVNKRGLIGYYSRQWKGEYETNIEVTKASDDKAGRLTVCFDEKSIIWNEEKQALCDYLNSNEFIQLERKPDKLVSNSKYLFIQIENILYQYDKSGKLIHQTEIKGDICYAGEKNVYYVPESQESVYILSADDISLAGEEPEMVTKEFAEMEMEIVGETTECYLATESLGVEARVEKTPEYVRVVTPGAYQTPKYVIGKDTGMEYNGSYFSCLGLYNDKLYAGQGDAEERLYKEKTDGTFESVTNFPVYVVREMEYSRCFRGDNYLVVLGEIYFAQGIGNGGNTSTGTLGDYKVSNLCYIDLETEEAVKEYEIKEGPVIYMDQEQYAVLKNGTIKLYSALDGKLNKIEKIENYENKHDYQIEVCNGKIFIFCDEIFLECVEVTNQ